MAGYWSRGVQVRSLHWLPALLRRVGLARLRDPHRRGRRHRRRVPERDRAAVHRRVR